MTSTGALVITFVGVLLVLTVAGLVMRVRSADVRAADPCRAASSAAARFQSAVTRDIGRPGVLRSDTAGFVGELRSLGATRCRETRRFLVSAESTIGELCSRCASDLRQVRLSDS